MEIQVGDIFKSNRGRGTLIARVVDITDNVVLMKRATSMTARRWTPFQLSLRYLNSTSCGWKKIKATK